MHDKTAEIRIRNQLGKVADVTMEWEGDYLVASVSHESIDTGRCAYISMNDTPTGFTVVSMKAGAKETSIIYKRD